MDAAGTFAIKSWTEEPYDEMDGGPTLVRASIATTFHGDLEGAGDTVYLMIVSADQTATFVGLERVVGRVGGRSGSFVFSDVGTFDGTTVNATWTIVPGSGTDDLVGMRGEGRFRAPRGATATFSLAYRFDDVAEAN
ncbi:MAG: DUF3224 domain-containing protein [Vulcanimicrobiaceae bacterium]